MKAFVKNKILIRINNYSKFVSLAKNICLCSIFVALVYLFIVPLVNPFNKQVDLLRDSDNSYDDKQKMIIHELDFLGNNSELGQYHIKAKKLIKEGNYSVLFGVNSYLDEGSEKLGKIDSDRGVIFADNKKLKLMDNVVMSYDGFNLLTDFVFIKNKNFEIFTTSFSTIKNGDSILKSEKGFVSYPDQGLAYFFGPMDGLYMDAEKKDKIKISSSRLTVNHKQKKATFFENLKADYNEMHLDADKMVYDYSKGFGINSIIYLYNNIKLITSEEIILGNSGIVDLSKNTLTIYNGVTLLKDKNTVKGDKFIYFFDQKKGEVFSSAKTRVKVNIILEKNEKK